MILKDFKYKPLNIKFKADGHTYALDGIPLIGVTTVINTKAKDFLKWWTVKVMYLFLQEKWDILKVYTKAEKEALLLEGKKKHTERTKKGGDSGTLGHDLIQKSIETGRRDLINTFDGDETLFKEVENIYKSWLEWEKSKKSIVYLATELVIGSKTMWTGGTLDAVAIVDDKLELLDWKTNNQLSEDVIIQTAGYKAMLIEGGVDKKIARRVVRLSKEKVEYQDKAIETNYDTDLNCFKSLVNIYRWDRDIKKLNPFNKPKYIKK